MTREPNAEDIVARWVDEGPEAAPERFVWAALNEVERTPQRGRWRHALENTHMFTKLAIPVVGAAAVLIVALLVSQRFGGLETGGDRPTPSPTPAVSPSQAADACRSDGVVPVSDGTIDVVWCIARGGGELVVIPFTLDGPSDWADEQHYTHEDSLYLRPSNSPLIAFSLNGPDSVDAWVEQFTGNAAYEVSDPEPIEIDGTTGFVLDVRLAPETAPEDAPPVLEDSELPVTIQEGGAARVWIVEAPTEALMIVTRAPEDTFTEWADTVGESVLTLQFGQ